MKKLKAIYFGTPDFSVPTLDALKNHPYVELAYVISMPDRKSGRGYQVKSPEVIEFAKENKIPYFQTENINKEDEFLNKIKNEKIDVFIVLAFAQFLSDDVLNIPSLGCFNIHTSLLPKYRGAAPIQYAILNGDTSTGVSIQKMVKKMDAGDLVWSQPISIDQEETGGQLYTKLKFQAALSVNDFLIELSNNRIQYTPQDESRVSFAPTLKREDGELNFKNKTYIEIKNQIRALYPWPGTYTHMDGKRLKVFSIVESTQKAAPGETIIVKNQLIIGCKDKSLRICELQLEGKKRCSDIDLFNGYKGEGKI